MGVRADDGAVGTPPAAESPARARTPLRAQAQAIIATLFVSGAVCFGVAAIWTRREEFGSALGSLSTLGIVTSAALSTVGVLLSAQVWMCSIRAVGGTFDAVLARRVFFATQVGKYLPGMAWPYIAQLRFASRFGIPRATMASAQAVFLTIHVATGGLLGCLALPWLLSTDRVPDGYVWILVPAAAAALVLHPAALRWAAKAIGRRRPDGLSIHIGSILRAIGWMSAVWLLYGAALAALVLPMTTNPDQAWLVCLGGYAFAWVIGFLVIVAPAGAGAREVVLIGVLSVVVRPVEAAAIAVVSRVLMTLVDLGLGAGAATAARRAGKQPTLTAAAPREASNHVS